MLPINKEVHAGVDATIACVITGITKQLDSLVWRKDGTDVKTLSPLNYLVSPGSYDSNSQTTTLTVKDVANKEDSIYTCVITSNEWLQTNKETIVTLNVFSKYHIKSGTWVLRYYDQEGTLFLKYIHLTITFQL